jgi:NADH-quinone oxidoreductase subunit G
VIPLASFYEKNGTYINCDGIKQKVISGMNKETPEHNITSLLEVIKSLLEKGNI